MFKTMSHVRGVTIHGVWISELDLLTAYTFMTCDYTLQMTDTHRPSVLSLLWSPLAVSWQRRVPREIDQLPALRSSCHKPPVQNSC
jgi:hypothetical protein